MGWKETLTAGLHKVGEGAEKAYGKGKAKAGELRTELQMDGVAKKLGYLTFDAHMGRKVDEALRAKLLSDLTYMESELEKAKAEAKAASEKAAEATKS